MLLGNSYKKIAANKSDSYNNYSQKKQTNDKQTVEEFSDILNSLIKNFSNQKNQYKQVLADSGSKFGKDIDDLYQQFMNSEISLAKFNAIKSSMADVKDIEEFTKLINKLIEEAHNNSLAAREALTMLLILKQEAEEQGKSSEETISFILSSINQFSQKLSEDINKEIPEYKESTHHAAALISSVLHSTKLKTEKNDKKTNKSDYIEEVYKSLNQVRKENNDLENLFSHFMKLKAKRKSKDNNEEKSTKVFLEKLREKEKFDQKIQEILSYARDLRKRAEGFDINQIISEIINTGIKPSSLHSTDISRLDDFVSSPVFA